MKPDHDPAADPVHDGPNGAARWGGWRWKEPRYGEHYRTCSFCGSVHPEDLAADIAGGAVIRAEWADMKYGWPHKLYIDLVPRDPGLLHVSGHVTGSAAPDRGPWVAAGDLTGEQRQIVAAGGWLRRGEEPSGWYQFTPKTTLSAKLYTVHLKDPAVGQEVKDAVQERAGLRFTWLDGKVAWQLWSTPGGGS